MTDKGQQFFSSDGSGIGMEDRWMIAMAKFGNN
jgi:hypothetical protein